MAAIAVYCGICGKIATVARAIVKNFPGIYVFHKTNRRVPEFRYTAIGFRWREWESFSCDKSKIHKNNTSLCKRCIGKHIVPARGVFFDAKISKFTEITTICSNKNKILTSCRSRIRDGKQWKNSVRHLLEKWIPIYYQLIIRISMTNILLPIHLLHRDSLSKRRLCVHFQGYENSLTSIGHYKPIYDARISTTNDRRTDPPFVYRI